MGNIPTAQVEERIRSAFPEGAIERVQVLARGGDPEVGPGETAVRVFLSRAGRPEGPEADKGIVTTVRDATWRPPVGWLTSCPSSSGSSSLPRAGQAWRLSPRCRGPPSGSTPATKASLNRPAGEPQEQLTPVMMTLLGTADLAAVDTLIAAGIGGSRAEILRWGLARSAQTSTRSVVAPVGHALLPGTSGHLPAPTTASPVGSCQISWSASCQRPAATRSHTGCRPRAGLPSRGQAPRGNTRDAWAPRNRASKGKCAWQEGKLRWACGQEAHGCWRSDRFSAWRASPVGCAGG